MEDFDSLDEIVATAEVQPDIDNIVDLAAQTSHKLEQWMDGSGVFDIFADTVWLNHCFSEFAKALKAEELLQPDYAD